MVVIRYLAGVTLVSALVAGCDQSLFDANPDNGRDGGPSDRQDASQPDARDGDRDAGPPLDCPVADCVGDAVGEFATNQDGPWRYVEVGAGALGFIEMEYDPTRLPPGWAGEEAGASSITSCDQRSEIPACSGLEDRLLLEPSVIAEQPPPALVWTAPETGTYRLTIDWRLDDTQTSEKPAQVLVARNSQFDRVLTASFNATTEVGTFPQGDSVDIEAVKGDSIAFALAGAMPTALGVKFYVSELEQNDSCQMAIDLEGPESFPNVCGDGGAFVENGSQPTQASGSAPGIPGVARTFSADSLLRYEGAVNDYSEDWTLQFWAKLEGTGEVLSDFSCRGDGTGVLAGGISVKFDGDAVYIAAGADFLIEDCALPPDGVSKMRDANFAPEDWHFYRLVRSRSATRLDVCVDDEILDTIALPAEAAIVTDRPLEIGNVSDTPEDSFTGQIADLRLYDRALPCLPGT